MSGPTFDDVTAGLQSTAIAALKDTLVTSWESLSEDERHAATALLKSIVKARLLQAIGRDVSDHLPVLEAAYLNWRVVGRQAVESAMETVAMKGFGFAGAFAAGALGQVIKGMIP